MYPQSNSARSVRDLSGVWDFRFNADESWQPIAVPASYNDQSPDPEFRRHYGMAYYRTTFTVPEGARRVLRFDAVTHNAVVRLNGQEIASHRGGFLPFEADITALAQPGETVTLDVEVDNRIGHSSLPVGNEGGTAFFGSDNAGIPAVEAGKARQQAQGINLPNFDFFNYAGITRPVHLYTTPAAYIRDVTVAADTQQLHVNAADLVQHSLVRGAGLVHVLSIAVRNMYVVFVDVDMVEQIVIHEVMIALIVGGLQRIVFIQIVGSNLAEIQSAFVVHTNQFFIGTNGRRTGSQTQNRIGLNIYDAGDDSGCFLAQGLVVFAYQNLYIFALTIGVP